MEAKWLEDFVSLAQSGSFSRSALARHVTQPAFSRRIQSLEAWVGVALIDRTSYPTRLTQAGKVFYEQALSLLGQLNTSRALLRGQDQVSAETIELAVPHTLSFVFVPSWIKQLEKKLGPIRVRLLAGNVHDAVLALAESSCDLLICYHHPQMPVELDLNRYDMKVIGQETVSPYSKRNKDGSAMFNLPGKGSAQARFLSYSANAYLGRVVELIRQQAKPKLHLDTVYETDMAEGLKMMALEGHGLAFLPNSLVSREVKAKQLVLVDSRFQEQVEIRVYRAKTEYVSTHKPIIDRLWKIL
jgi:LysR family transcriptional regulator, hypochlorite-specific transcription factor HypT